MAVRRARGSRLWVATLVAGVGAYASLRLGWVERARRRGAPPAAVVALSPGDFPPGVTAPVGEYAALPLRPTRVGFTPGAASAGLLDATRSAASSEPGRGEPLMRQAYALDVTAVPFAREDELRRALAAGAEAGGVDLAALGVDQLARWAGPLRDAAPRTVLLLGRSRGQEALAAVGVANLAGLKGRRLASDPESPAHFFALWLLSRAGLGAGDVRWVALASTAEAGAALREGKADAAAGIRGDVEPAARERGGVLLATTADAPHLLATVLVARGDFAARYPDAVRRTLRGLLDASAALTKDPSPAARILGEATPALGDPLEAVKAVPPASLKDNLAFFGLAGEAPVTYDELYRSASALAVKLGLAARPVPADETRDLGPLRYVAEARGP